MSNPGRDQWEIGGLKFETVATRMVTVPHEQVLEIVIAHIAEMYPGFTKDAGARTDINSGDIHVIQRGFLKEP